VQVASTVSTQQASFSLSLARNLVAMFLSTLFTFLLSASSAIAFPTNITIIQRHVFLFLAATERRQFCNTEFADRSLVTQMSPPKKLTSKHTKYRQKPTPSPPPRSTLVTSVFGFDRVQRFSLIGVFSRCVERFHSRRWKCPVRDPFSGSGIHSKPPIRDSQISAQLQVMNQFYASAGISWVLAATTRTVNADWFNNAAPGTSQQTAMKNALRTSDANSLNVYTVGYVYSDFVLGAFIHYRLALPLVPVLGFWDTPPSLQTTLATPKTMGLLFCSLASQVEPPLHTT